MSRDDVYLLDMLNAARRARRHVAGKSRDATLQDAAVRAVEVVGEAAGLVIDEDLVALIETLESLVSAEGKS